MAAYFVTSTGTDIGKTFVIVGLIGYLREAGQAVQAIKPVVSGYDPSVVDTSDPAVLLAALGLEVSADQIDRIAPWRFRAPLAPDIARRAKAAASTSRSSLLSAARQSARQAVCCSSRASAALWCRLMRSTPYSTG